MNTKLFGREDEVDALWDAIVDHRVLFLDGPRGVGKTELLERANALARGGRHACWIPLDGAATLEAGVGLVQRRIGGIRTWGRRVGDFFRGTDPVEQLVTVLEDRPAGMPLALLLDEVPAWLDRLGQRQSEVLRRLTTLTLGSDTTIVLAGSYGMSPLMRAFAVAVAPPFRITVRPLDADAGHALFVHTYDDAADDVAGRLAWEEAGGLPRWIERLGQHTRRPKTRAADTTDVEVGIDSITTDPSSFVADVEHLRRYGASRRWAAAYLLAVAEEGATPSTVRTAVQAVGATRRDVDHVGALLLDDQFLSEEFTLRVPLFRRWLRRHGCR